MLKMALTALKSTCPLLKVQVFVGNPAESVYHNLGFAPGVERHSLRVPASEPPRATPIAQDRP